MRGGCQGLPGGPDFAPMPGGRRPGCVKSQKTAKELLLGVDDDIAHSQADRCGLLPIVVPTSDQRPSDLGGYPGRLAPGWGGVGCRTTAPTVVVGVAVPLVVTAGPLGPSLVA